MNGIGGALFRSASEKKGERASMMNEKGAGQ
jgi:hypothetical protein